MKERKRRTASIRGGDTTHLRYQHYHRPAKVDVVCPRCGKRAVATNRCYRERGSYSCVDLCPYRQIPTWEVRCVECVYYETEKDYEDIGELFYVLESRGRSLWAWSREHLVMLQKLMMEQEISDDEPYAFDATYARREWLQGSRKTAWAKVIQKTLSE